MPEFPPTPFFRTLTVSDSSDRPKRVFAASAEAEASAEYYAEASAEARSFGSRPKLRSRAEASVLSRSFGSKPKVPSLYLECPAD